MFRKVTVLRRLQKILSGKEHKLFDNQVCFYNGIFGTTNPEIFPEELVTYMETAENVEPGERKKQEIEAFFRSGLDNSSSNVGKHINDEPGMAIPKFHCVHYAQAKYRAEICKRLAAQMNYPNASYHLALYFYSEGGLAPDETKYMHFLEKASFDGSAKASIALGKLALSMSAKKETETAIPLRMNVCTRLETTSTMN